jgi:hypothetical protein
VIAEVGTLLRPPLVREQVERANRLLVSLARNAPHGRVANLAMQLMNVVLAANEEDKADADRIGVALAKLRTAAAEFSIS